MCTAESGQGLFRWTLSYWALSLVLLGGDLWGHHDLTASFPSFNVVSFTPVRGPTTLHRQTANAPVVGLHRPGLRGSAFLFTSGGSV